VLQEMNLSSVTTYYLEMTAPEQLVASPVPEGLTIVEAEIKQYRLNRFLYQLVGEPWQWVDKLSLSDAQWRDYAESDDLRTWVAYHRGAIAGYYELQRQDGGAVELKYFGLAPDFIGRGFGGPLLSHAIRAAWDWGDTARVWVHTCTLDHPSALGNYQARGFRIYDTEVEAR
jgi:GNAT superfamily N-acetyltransferase